MAGNYSVQQGDHLAKIAKAFGFSDYRTIWDHGNNAALKQKRKNPNVLHPGDILYIPDLEHRKDDCPTDKRHTFVLSAQPLKLQIVLEDRLHKPIANTPCTLILGSEFRKVKTDSAGRLSEPIPPDAGDAKLVFEQVIPCFAKQELLIRIGNLDPVEEISGQVARLNNLGYFAGDVSQPDPMEFRSAVEEFQCDHSLAVDGICGPNTQAKLKQVHGC